MLSSSMIEVNAAAVRFSRQFNGSLGREAMGMASEPASISKSFCRKYVFPKGVREGMLFDKRSVFLRLFTCSAKRHEMKSLISFSGRVLKIGASQEICTLTSSSSVGCDSCSVSMVRVG